MNTLSCCAVLAGFPWLWWALTVVVAYLVGWLWYSVIFKKEWIALERRGCNCGPDCTCGCQEGKECTCDDNCKCCHGSTFGTMMPMFIQLAATAVLGFMFFITTGICVWLSLGLAVAFAAWNKAGIFFRAGWNKRGRNLVWIDVSYLFIVLLLFIIVAAALEAGACCACGLCG